MKARQLFNQKQSFSGNNFVSGILIVSVSLFGIFSFSGCVFNCTMEPDFSASATTINVGESITFTNQTTGEYQSGTWYFTGVETRNLVGNTETVTYSTPGTYSVSLTVAHDRCESVTETKTNYITVLANPIVDCDAIGTVNDVDGNTYTVIQIGSQCWLKENLRTTKYNDGTPIVTGLDDDDWENTTEGAYAIFDNDPVNDYLYGKLYNFYAVASGKLCPEGWHIPTFEDWEALVAETGEFAEALKATTGWVSGSATNSSGFSALPGSFRTYYGSFGFSDAMLGQYAGFWSSTFTVDGEGDTNGHLRYMLYNDEFIQSGENLANTGLSCRCVHD